jgi:hypothetical protein
MNSASLIDWRAVMGPGLQCAFWAFAIAPQQASGSQHFVETAERVRSINEMDVASKVTQLLKRARPDIPY